MAQLDDVYAAIRKYSAQGDKAAVRRLSAYADSLAQTSPIQAQPLDAGGPINVTAETKRDPGVRAAIATAPEYTPPAPKADFNDWVNQSELARFSLGLQNVGAGVIQNVAMLGGKLAEALGVDQATAERYAQSLLRDEATATIQRNKGAVRGAMARTADYQREKSADVAQILPESWREPYAQMDVLGEVGAPAAAFAMVPAGPAGAGIPAALGRIGTNIGTGAAVGAVTPQEVDPNLGRTAENAAWGAVAAGAFSSTLEGVRGAYQWLSHMMGDNAARTIAESAGDRLPEVVASIQAHQQAVPGYEPTAGDMAVNANVPNFSALGEASRGVLPNAGLRADASRAMAQTDQADRVGAALAAQRRGQPVAGADPLPTPQFEPPPEVPFAPMTERTNQTISARQAAIDQATTIKAQQSTEVVQRQALADEGMRGTKANIGAQTEQARWDLNQRKAATAQDIQATKATQQAALAAAQPQRLAQEQSAIEAQRVAAEAEARTVAANIPEANQAELGGRITQGVKTLNNLVQTHVVAPKYEAAISLAGDARMPISDATKAAGDVSTLAAFNASLEPEVSATLAQRIFGGGDTSTLSMAEYDQASRAVNTALGSAMGSSSPEVRQIIGNLRRLRAALDADFQSAPFSAESKAAYQEAVNTYKAETVPRFRTGVSPKLLQVRNGTSAIPPSNVVDALFQSGGKTDNAQQFVTSVQNTDAVLASEGADAAQQASADAVAAMRQGVEDRFRREVTDAVTGKVDINKAKHFLSREGTHGRQVDVLEAVMPGLRTSLEGYRDAARRVQMTTQQLDRTAAELPLRLSAEAKVESARIKAEAQAKLDAAKRNFDVQARQIGEEARRQKEVAFRAGEDTKSALTRHLEEQQARAQADIDAAKAELEQAKALAGKTNFTDGETLFRRSIADETVRQQVLTNMTGTERRALATRAEWEINRLTDPEKRLAYLGKNQRALNDIFRASDPQGATERLTTFRQQAEAEWVKLQADRQAAGVTTADPIALQEKRLADVRSKIDALLATDPGSTRIAYEAEKGRYGVDLSPEQRRSIDALAQDVNQQLRRQNLASRAGRDYKSILDVHTRHMQNNGEAMPTLTHLTTVLRFLQKIVGARMNKATQERLARIMLEGSPDEIVGTLQRGQGIIDRENAVRGAAIGVERLGVPAAAQSAAQSGDQQ